jgi:ribosomal protein L30/L7E
MPADSLTKVLPRPKHKSFVKQLGLKDIRSLITLQENKEEEEKGVKLLV